jgi:hypothetical protein
MTTKDDVDFLLKLSQIFASIFIGFGIIFYSITVGITTSSIDMTKIVLDLREKNITLTEIDKSLLIGNAKLFGDLNNGLPYIIFFFGFFFVASMVCWVVALFLKVRLKIKNKLSF